MTSRGCGHTFRIVPFPLHFNPLKSIFSSRRSPVLDSIDKGLLLYETYSFIFGLLPVDIHTLFHPASSSAQAGTKEGTLHTSRNRLGHSEHRFFSAKWIPDHQLRWYIHREGIQRRPMAGPYLLFGAGSDRISFSWCFHEQHAVGSGYGQTNTEKRF